MLSWAPDGEWLAFAEKPSADAPTRIFRLSLATLEKRPLTSPPPKTLGDIEPQISPDGRLLAFVRGRSPSYGNQDVWVQPVNGGEARRLTSGQYGFAAALSWTPDGAEIVFTSGSPIIGGSRMARVPLAGGASQPVVGVGENAVHASVRGKLLVYIQSAIAPMDIWRLPLAGAPRSTEPPARFLVSAANAAYSPDGRKVAFDSERGGVNGIWLSNADGSHPFQLTTFKRESGTARWSPDSRRLVFDSIEAGNRDLYVVGTDGGTPRRLTQEPADEVTPTWSRDGSAIYFQSDRTGRAETWRIPADGGTAVQVTRGGGGYAVESEDGRDLYFGKASGVWRLPLSGGDESEVVKGPVDMGNWALTRRGLYYATIRSQVSFRREEFRVQYLDFASGLATPLFRKEGVEVHWTLTVSPDEKWILFGEIPGLAVRADADGELPLIASEWPSTRPTRGSNVIASPAGTFKRSTAGDMRPDFGLELLRPV